MGGARELADGLLGAPGDWLGCKLYRTSKYKSRTGRCAAEALEATACASLLAIAAVAHWDAAAHTIHMHTIRYCYPRSARGGCQPECRSPNSLES